MPQDESYSPLMCHQVNDWFVKVTIKSNVWNLPDLDRTVLTGAGNDVVVVWTPLNVEHGGSVT